MQHSKFYTRLSYTLLPAKLFLNFFTAMFMVPTYEYILKEGVLRMQALLLILKLEKEDTFCGNFLVFNFNVLEFIIFNTRILKYLVEMPKG